MMTITERQREVALAVAREGGQRQAALVLNISLNTVRNLTNSARRNTRSSSTAQLVYRIMSGEV